MASITKASPTFVTPQAATVVANGSLTSVYTLDLKTKEYAVIHCFIGRQAATALTRSAYVAIRRTDNDTLSMPITMFDVSSQTIAAANTTLSAAAAIADTTVTLASATGFVIGDTICISGASAARVEFHRIANITGSVLTLDRACRIAHNSGDNVRNLADVVSQYIPGGDVYGIRCVNASGQDLLFMIEAEVDGGYTST
jgi:hypothetical protein